MEFQGFDTNFSLSGRNAIITGGAAGIGRAIAELYVTKGARVILLDKDTEVANVAQEIDTDKALGLEVDVTNKHSVESAVDQVKQRIGRIDILVNNAGVVALDRPEDVNESDWDLTMSVNLKGIFLMSQAVGSHMLANQNGRIINMASQAGVVSLPKHLAYCTSKAGVIGMTKSLASEWGPSNVQVNSISPTVALTELGKKAWAGDPGEKMKSAIPSGRFVYPDEIAACALYLASDASAMINGANIVIDGGYSIQ